jgi:3-deoxy-D-manno-octulosonic-acid transferase
LKFFYYLFITAYPILARLLSVSNEKAKLWVKGRQSIFNELEKAFANNTAKVVWMHCASLGEFEQGLPIVEQLKLQQSNTKFLITFFSPSGYEVRKNYQGAEWIFYLPMDNAKNAKRFYDIVKPSLVLFVKYEFWFYYLQEAKQRDIPLLLVSGIFRENQVFFKRYGSFYRKMLQSFSYCFVQNQASADLLASIGITNNVSVSGDTRFDRVKEIAARFSPIQIIEDFIGNDPVIVAGSTWLEDDKELQHYAKKHPHIKFIIAPHDIQQSRIDECVGLYKNVVLYSDLVTGHGSLVIGNNTELKTQNIEHASSNQQPVTNNILLINNIGLLSKLYHYATICFVGGGFGDEGIHNVLEAAVYGKPVVFGPVYDKYIEAEELIDAGGGFTVDNALELEALFNQLLADKTAYDKASIYAGYYVASKVGATDEIVGYIIASNLIN